MKQLNYTIITVFLFTLTKVTIIVETTIYLN